MLALRPAEVSICDDGILLKCQKIGPFPGQLDSSSLVGAVDLYWTDLCKIWNVTELKM